MALRKKRGFEWYSKGTLMMIQKKYLRIFFGAFFALFFLGAFSYIAFIFSQKSTNLMSKQVLDSRADSFVADIREGINGDQTRSKAYIFVHRYLDNGGNIYETYQSVQDYPELEFLKEAEDIHPRAFEMIRKNQIAFTYSDEGMYAFLAYAEVLDKYGYANSTLLSTIAHRYAQMAYFKNMIREDHVLGKSLNYPEYTESQISDDLNRSIIFARKSQETMRNILDRGASDVSEPNQEILEAASQYGLALRYLESMAVDVQSLIKASDTFEFAGMYAHSYFPSLYLWTALQNATSLLLIDSATPSDMYNAAYPFFASGDLQNSQSELVRKIIGSRSESRYSRYADLTPYSRENIVNLAREVPDFKEWLILSGWNATDF